MLSPNFNICMQSQLYFFWQWRQILSWKILPQMRIVFCSELTEYPCQLFFPTLHFVQNNNKSIIPTVMHSCSFHADLMLNKTHILSICTMHPCVDISPATPSTPAVLSNANLAQEHTHLLVEAATSVQTASLNNRFTSYFMLMSEWNLICGIKFH